MKMGWMKLALGIGAAFGVGLVMLTSFHADAADHNDPPGRTRDGDSPDKAADIADLYAWHADDKVTIVLTFGGPLDTTADQEGLYDEDVLYTINVSTDEDPAAERSIYVRFGQNDAGDWGVQVTNLPGATGVVVGPVETNIDAGGGAMVFAGLRDDPFFFDLQGFGETLATGELGFDNTRDFFAGRNITAIVLEVNADDIVEAKETAISMWATTGRIGG